MEILNGYQYEKSDCHNSPNGTWFKATKGGNDYFLKKFIMPKYPKEGISPDLYEEKKRECEEWLSSKKRLITALGELGDGRGNIISPREVFREKLSFYQSTYWIEIKTESLDQIKRYPLDKKILLLKTFAMALNRVHGKNIIHGDLKPENILIGSSGTGNPVAKLIDFDDSYFSKEAPPPDLTICTDAYQSPELAAYKMGAMEYRPKLTCASDVFASGIIMHQFWTGKMPDYPGAESGAFLYQAVVKGEKYTLDSSLPAWFANLLHAMLDIDPTKRPTMEEVHQALTARAFGAAKTVVLDYSKLDKVQAMVPTSLSGYTTESVANLTSVQKRVKELRASATTQDVLDKCTGALFNAIKALRKDTPKITADYSKLDQVLKTVPKNLDDYTEDTVANVKKVVSLIAENRGRINQDSVNKLTVALHNAKQQLVEKPRGDFSIRPASPLPDDVSKVTVLSETKVRVISAKGNTMVVPVTTALLMGWVVER